MPHGMQPPMQPADPPQVGTVPAPFNDLPSTYTHANILNLVVFYNDDFDIQAGDSITTRQDKLRLWLMSSGM